MTAQNGGYLSRSQLQYLPETPERFRYITGLCFIELILLMQAEAYEVACEFKLTPSSEMGKTHFPNGATFLRPEPALLLGQPQLDEQFPMEIRSATSLSTAKCMCFYYFIILYFISFF